MNKIILFTVLLFSMTTNGNLNCVENTGISIDDSEYTIHIDIETSAANEQNLIIKMDLKDDSHFVSPYDKGNLSGQFYMDFGAYNNIDFVGGIIESPNSKAEPMNNVSCNSKRVRWVRTDTTYKQPLDVISKGDFQIFGRVKFVIEPRCTLEEIPFAIVSENEY